MVACKTLLLVCLLAVVAPAYIQATVEDDVPINTDPSPVEDTQDFPDIEDDVVYPDQAVLIAHKHPLEDRIVHGLNLTMVVTLHNVGNGTAENVSVKDKLEEGAKVDLIEGQLEQSVYSIDAGRSADFKYVVIPRSGQAAFVASPAEVTYTSSEGMPPTKLLSTSSHVKVLSWAQNVERKLVTLGRFASLGVLKTSRDWFNSCLSFSLIAVVCGGLYLLTTVNRTRASSLRRSAERALGVDQ